MANASNIVATRGECESPRNIVAHVPKETTAGQTCGSVQTALGACYCSVLQFGPTTNLQEQRSTTSTSMLLSAATPRQLPRQANGFVATGRPAYNCIAQQQHGSFEPVGLTGSWKGTDGCGHCLPRAKRMWPVVGTLEWFTRTCSYAFLLFPSSTDHIGFAPEH